MRNIKISWQIICICGLILLGSTLFTSCSAVTSFYFDDATFYEDGTPPDETPDFLTKLPQFIIIFALGTDGEPIVYLWIFAFVSILLYMTGATNSYTGKQYWHKDYFSDNYVLRDEVASYGSEEGGKRGASFPLTFLICVWEFMLIWNHTSIRNALAIVVIVILLFIEAIYLVKWCHTYFFYLALISWVLVLADFVIGCIMYLYQISF